MDAKTAAITLVLGIVAVVIGVAVAKRLGVTV